MKCSDAYYFACPEKLLNVPGVRLFRDWIATRAAATNQVSAPAGKHLPTHRDLQAIG